MLSYISFITIIIFKFIAEIYISTCLCYNCLEAVTFLNEEIKLHIKKLQIRASLSFIAIMLTIISIGFGILFLAVRSFFATIFFAITVISVVYLIKASRVAQTEEKEAVFNPFVFSSDKNFSFDETIEVFKELTDKENQLSLSEDVRFFRFNKIFKLRVILYRTADFDKKVFSNAKSRINKKVNKELRISHWLNFTEAAKMMRLNIIFSNTLSNALYEFISQNANHNLTRAEGVINIVIVGNKILIPPIFGECDFSEIGRYKGVIKFINEVLLKK